MALDWDDGLAERVKQAALVGVFRGGKKVQNTAVKKITSGPKSGRTYRRRGVTHQASAPGEPPASDTGRLAKSGRTELVASEVKATVTFSTEYAEKLELGTEKMDPRPFLRPSLEESREKVMEYVKSEIGRVVK